MEKATEIYKLIGISKEDYDTAFFEAGCYAAEQRYSAKDAVKVKSRKMYWNWLRTQQCIVDTGFLPRLQEFKYTSKQAFDAYYKMLRDHFVNVYPPLRFDHLAVGI